MDKLSFDLAVRLESVKGDEAMLIIVAFSDAQHMPKALGGEPGERHFRFQPMVALRARKGDIEGLARRREVSRIWQDLPVYACLDVSVPLVGAPRIWQAGYTGRGVCIAIVDTGIDAEHPALRDRVIAMQDMTGEGSEDGNGHGTHVAGIAAGEGAPYQGVAPEASLMAVKVLRGDGSGMTSDVMAGIEWATENGAWVINMSLGSGVASDGNDPLSLICDAAVARGVVVCVAAGNSGPGRGTIGSPGAARRVITVGASTDQDLVADFSSRGPTADGRIKPDILFPGYGIVSCRARGTTMGRPMDAYYTEASGTSMATPHASGAAALLLQARSWLRPQQVKELLGASAKDLGLPANTQGAGRAQVDQAFTRQPAPEPTPPPTPQPRGCLPALVRLPWLRPARA